jgi:hypothetical protein
MAWLGSAFTRTSIPDLLARAPDKVDQPVDHDPLDDQRFLSRLREFLDCAFNSQRKAPGADDPLKNKMERPPASKRFRAFATLPRMFRDPTTHVGRNARVESAISTPHDVDRPST